MTPVDFGIIDEILPDSSGHYMVVEVWELDSGLNGDDDYIGQITYEWNDRGVNRIIGGGNMFIELIMDWIPRAPSYVDNFQLIPKPMELDPNESRYAYAYPFDQYGYHLERAVSWSIDDPSVATVVPSGDYRATVTAGGAMAAGDETTLRATASGYTEGTTVIVTQCMGDICPEFVDPSITQ